MSSNEKTVIRKRKPYISVIIISNNNPEHLKRCIDSVEPLLNNDIRNIEVIVINNFTKNKGIADAIATMTIRHQAFQETLFFYQTDFSLTTSQLKNLGIDFSKGTWLYFMLDTETMLPSFARFLITYKFNLQIGFYRVPVMSYDEKRHKKAKMGLFKPKYYSTLPSSLILNEEFIEKIKLKWDSTLTYNGTLLFLDKIYSWKNVNFTYLKNNYSVIHNFSLDNVDTPREEIVATLNALSKNKQIFWKQFSIILLYKYLYERRTLAKEEDYIFVKTKIKQEKIHFWSFFFLGRKWYFKTLGMWWKVLFTNISKSSNEEVA